MTKESTYLLFEQAVDAIMGSNVIMTAQPLNNLTRLIAYNEQIAGCVRECYRGIHYEKLLQQSLIKDEDGEYTFVLPHSKRAVVALISKLLYEFAKGTQSVETLSQKLYPKEDVRGAYTRFCEDILLPYKESFKDLFFSDMSEEEPETAEVVSVINSAIVAEVCALAGELRSELPCNNRLSTSVRAELTALVDGLCEVMESDLPKLVKPSWLGIKYAFSGIRKCADTLRRLESLLSSYLLI